MNRKAEARSNTEKVLRSGRQRSESLRLPLNFSILHIGGDLLKSCAMVVL